MDTIVRPPGTPPLAPIAGRRHWPRRVAFTAAVVLLSVVAGGSIWIANYDPFIPGSRGYGPQDPRIRVTEVDALGTSGRVYDFPAGGPARFRYTFSIVNDGPVAVTIEGVGPPIAEQTSEITRRPVRVIPDERTPGPDGNLVYTAWHPVVLAPGGEAGIEMELTFDPRVCVERGSRFSAWPETIRYSVFGIHRTTTFESDLEVRIVGSERCS